MSPWHMGRCCTMLYKKNVQQGAVQDFQHWYTLCNAVLLKCAALGVTAVHAVQN